MWLPGRRGGEKPTAKSRVSMPLYTTVDTGDAHARSAATSRRVESLTKQNGPCSAKVPAEVGIPVVASTARPASARSTPPSNSDTHGSVVRVYTGQLSQTT